MVSGVRASMSSMPMRWSRLTISGNAPTTLQ
jgi:hypothetical protein